MRKTLTFVFIAAMLLVVTLSACAPTQNMQEQNIEALQPSETHWVLPPAVFVNDTYYQTFENRQQYVPELDETWIYLGDIQNTVPGYESPTENFQANTDIVGAEIYHSHEGRIPITTSTWGDPLDNEVFGDSVIVVFEGQRWLCISEDARTEVTKISDDVVRSSLMIDGQVFSLMGSVGDSGYNLDNHTFLGEVTSTVPLNEYPTENLQANREIVVGMKVYRVPSDENDSVIVFHTVGNHYLYSLLPGTTEAIDAR